MPAGPGAGGGPAASGGGSIPKIQRGQSARSVLKLQWEYPTYVADAEELDGRTAAKRALKALSREDALAYIAGKDPRPLLILRECKTCNGTDDALLSRGVVDNEKTFLLARWFHCVKLPVAVLEPDHPFHNLFDAKDPEHMFLCASDGSSRIALESERSRVELWGAMNRVLSLNYEKGPEDTVKKMQKAIDQFDRVDQRVTELEKKVDGILETDGPEAKKLKKVQDELAAAKQERAELFALIENATRELKLRTAKSADSGEPAVKKS